MFEKKIIIFLLFSLFPFCNTALNFGQDNRLSTIPPPFEKVDTFWVDSVINRLSLEERIAQLFMIRAHSNKGKEHIEHVEKLIKKYKVGGLIFFQGGPVRQANLTNHYQKITQTPLLIAMDAEWGLAMRLDSTIRYPRQMQLGAIKNDSLIYEMGAEIARQCKRLGVHINFAPVIDVNNNPDNPVIGSRSFGDNVENVSKKGLAYMAGMQDNRILPTAKHFPGHGDTDKDSHKTLPIIKHDKKRLDSIELVPFKKLIKAGLGGIMVAHLNIPALDSSKNSVSSLSHNIITKLLKEELDFRGMIFTDGLGMKGVTEHYNSAEAAVKGIVAGNDILILPADLEKAIDGVKKAIKDSIITEEIINQRCRKVLKLKKWAGLDKVQKVKIDSLYEDLNSKEAKSIKRKLIENATGLLLNKDNILPLKDIHKYNIASFSVGAEQGNEFQEILKKYRPLRNFSTGEGTSANIYNMLADTISKYELVIVGLHGEKSMSEEVMTFVNKLIKKTKTIVCSFNSPYNLSRIENIEEAQAVISAYQNTVMEQSVSAQIIFGGIGTDAGFPVCMKNKNNELMFKDKGIKTKKIRLGYTKTEVIANPEILKSIDTIINNAIDDKTMPGCRILAAKDGMIFFNKAYGWHTYKKKTPVKNDDLYDMASVTKITATLPSLMKMTDEGRIDINKKLADYMPELENTNKEKMKIKDILLHQARLAPWIPFFLKTIGDTAVYSAKPTKDKQLCVADNMYISEKYKDTIMSQIKKSKLLIRKHYRYSDLGFIMFGFMIADKNKKPLNIYADSLFYKPLGAYNTTFVPLAKFDRKRIVPTENDTKFRKQQINGYVHDQASAMLGGVAGHAGLFSTAEDMAKIMQMYLQGGEYGGKRYISEKTMLKFTSAQKSLRKRKKNRRGLGFDKPILDKKGKPAHKWLSAKSFGHSGFTGTLVWADPDTNIVYVFLSNRVHPDTENNKLLQKNIRRNVQHIIYRACGY